MKTTKNDILLGLSELDESLIEQADPYTEKTKVLKTGRRAVRVRTLVTVSAVAAAVILGVLVSRGGLFGIRKPAEENPVGRIEPTPNDISVPPMTPMPATATTAPTGALTAAPTAMPTDAATPTPTESESKRFFWRNELSFEELAQYPFYSYLPKKMLQYYEFMESFAASDSEDSEEYYVIWFAKGPATLGIRVREASDVADAARRRVSASETERYDITKYEIPYAQTIPEELKSAMYNPIFRAEEFSRDVLLRRIEHHSESVGDIYSVHLDIEEGGYIFSYNFNGSDMYDIFPTFGMNPIPDKVPPEE